METHWDFIKKEQERTGRKATLEEIRCIEIGWEAALTTQKVPVAKLHCSDGLSCPYLHECDAVEERVEEKKVLVEALKEIYNIRGEDRDIARIINKALYEAMAT